MTLKEGTLLQGGKYRIVRFISSGGFGCTYEAEHVMLEERVAVKEFFVQDFCNRDEMTNHVSVGTESKRPIVEKLKRKFIDEAKALRRLNHPGIVRTSDVFEENGTAYFVMDYIKGCSLEQVVKSEGPLTEARALRYIRQVAEALAYVHANNRLHLDLKPGNIMLGADDRTILIDFGASKQYDEESGENTSTLLGYTIGYAPPEQMGNSVGHFLPATDIYALGATLYKLLGAKTPLGAHLRASGRELAPLPNHISSSVLQAVAVSMSMNEKKRPQSIAEFLKLLDAEAEVIKPKVENPEEPMDDRLDEEADITDTRAEVTKPIYSVALAAGISLFDAKDYDAALVHFKRMLTDYPEHRADIEECIARCEEALKPKKKWKWLRVLGVFLAVALVGWVVYDFTIRAPFISSSSLTQTSSINGHIYADLGLSVKWATCNIGADSPSEYGDYFAWGEVEPKENYDWNTYKWSNGSYDALTKYCTDSDYGVVDNKTVLDLRDDAARSNWGGKWRLPTKSELEELEAKCTWKWVRCNGVEGYKVTGPNGNSIFLPAAGYRRGTSLNNAGSYGSYWSATPNEGNSLYAYDLYFNSSGQGVDWDYRYGGRSVRPVAE